MSRPMWLRALAAHMPRQRYRLRVRHVHLGRRFDLRVVVVADIHAREDWFPPQRLRAIVDRVNALPDVSAVLMPGDFVDERSAPISWCASELGRLTAPVFASLGNHDVLTNPDRITSALADAGIEVLVNRAKRLRDDVFVAGLDSTYRAPDPARLRAGVPDGASLIVLGHEPQLATRHNELLHVAAHTHNGQVRLPFVLPLYLPRYSRPYPYGLYRLPHGRYVYTTSGVGYSTLPIRILSPPEIAVIDL